MIYWGVDRIGVLGIMESWLNAITPSSLVNIEGYNLLRNDRLWCRGGGTCLYVKNDLEFESPCKPINDKDVELQMVNILGREGRQDYKPISIILVYRPPNCNNQKACDIIKEFINGIPHLDDNEVVIMGDLNWDASDKNSIGYKYVVEIGEEFGLTQYIMSPTRVTEHGSSLIGVLWSNMNNVAYAGCMNYQLSDHCPVYIVKKRVAQDKEFRYVYKRSFRYYDVTTFQERLASLDWSMISLLNVDEMWEMVVRALTYEADQMCPFKWMKINISKPLWFTSHMNEVARSRDILFRNYLRGKRKNVELYEKAVKKKKSLIISLKNQKTVSIRNNLNYIRVIKQNSGKL